MKVHIYHLAAFSLLSLTTADNGLWTITADPAYPSQRPCGQACFLGNGGYHVPYELGCASPYSDACVCRADLTSSGHSYLSTCVKTLCASNSVDINSALSIYDGYCSAYNKGAGAGAAPATNDVVPTANGAGDDAPVKTVVITATVITTAGSVVTSPIAPVTTVISGDNTNYNNVIQIGSGNTQNAGRAGVEVSFVLSAVLALGVVGVMMGM